MASTFAHFTSGALELEAAATFGSVTNTTTIVTIVFATAQRILKEHDNNNIRRPCKNIFSNMIQISPMQSYQSHHIILLRFYILNNLRI